MTFPNETSADADSVYTQWSGERMAQSLFSVYEVHGSGRDELARGSSRAARRAIAIPRLGLHGAHSERW